MIKICIVYSNSTRIYFRPIYTCRYIYIYKYFREKQLEHQTREKERALMSEFQPNSLKVTPRSFLFANTTIRIAIAATQHFIFIQSIRVPSLLLSTYTHTHTHILKYTQRSRHYRIGKMLARISQFFTKFKQRNIAPNVIPLIYLFTYTYIFTYV